MTKHSTHMNSDISSTCLICHGKTYQTPKRNTVMMKAKLFIYLFRKETCTKQMSSMYVTVRNTWRNGSNDL